MNDELENQLRDLGSAMRGQLDEATVVARRESAIRSALRARQVAEVEPRVSFVRWFAELLTPGALAPSAGVCLLLLGLIFVFRETPSPSVLSTPVRVAEPSSIIVADAEDEESDELAEDISLVSASLGTALEAELEHDGGEDEDAMGVLSFSEDDFDLEEDFGSEYGTETI